MTTARLYDHDVELEEAPDGVVTDVVVLARKVRYNDDGKAEDELVVSTSNGVTYMVQQGMANTFLLALGTESGWDSDED